MSVRALAVLCALLAAAPAAAEGPAAPVCAPDNDPVTGYRMQNFRAPVTLPVQGGTRADLDAVDRLRAEGAALIDVMPQRGGYDPANGAWRIVDRRATIPGATWLPETGRGTIEPRLAAYLAGWLRRLSGGDPGRPIIFFCMADCWMSWNAVRRAADIGYTRVYWFAEGTDGWSEADRPTVPALPPPVPPLGRTAEGPPDGP